MKKRTILFFILTIFWMVVVFSFSAETASESKQTSIAVLNQIADFLNINIIDTEFFEGLIRSCAHFALFAMGGVFAGTLAVFAVPKYKLIATGLFGLGYAVLDEIHQIFVPGRAFEIKDIVVDVSGFLLGVVFVWLVVKIGRKMWASCPTENIK